MVIRGDLAGGRSSPPPRLASKVVKLGTVTALSALVVGFCVAQNRPREIVADCVDLTDIDDSFRYRVVDDRYCDDDDDGSHYSSSRYAYRWYYGGRRTAPRSGRPTPPSTPAPAARSSAAASAGARSVAADVPRARPAVPVRAGRRRAGRASGTREGG
jgi:hypothetical protein